MATCSETTKGVGVEGVVLYPQFLILIEWKPFVVRKEWWEQGYNKRPLSFLWSTETCLSTLVMTILLRIEYVLIFLPILL